MHLLRFSLLSTLFATVLSQDSSSCNICNDEPSGTMIESGLECATFTNLLIRCNTHYNWSRMKFCQKSCFIAGVGYEGDNCCADTLSFAPVTAAPGTSAIPIASPIVLLPNTIILKKQEKKDKKEKTDKLVSSGKKGSAKKGKKDSSTKDSFIPSKKGSSKKSKKHYSKGDSVSPSKKRSAKKSAETNEAEKEGKSYKKGSDKKSEQESSTVDSVASASKKTKKGKSDNSGY